MSGGVGPRILNLDIRRTWVVKFKLQPLYPQRQTRRYPLDRRLGGTQPYVSNLWKL